MPPVSQSSLCNLQPNVGSNPWAANKADLWECWGGALMVQKFSTAGVGLNLIMLFVAYVAHCPETTPPLSQLSFDFFNFTLSHFLNCKCHHFYSFCPLIVFRFGACVCLLWREKSQEIFLFIFCLRTLVFSQSRPSIIT